MNSPAAVMRDMLPEDLPYVMRIHQSDKFDLSELTLTEEGKINPLYLTRKVLTIDGKIVCAVLAKMNVEALLVMDHGDWGTADQKFLAIKALQTEGKKDLWSKGIDKVYSYTTENVGRYKKRLEQLGWTVKNTLTSWVQSTKTEGTL